jgi:hypothetical protein
MASRPEGPPESIIISQFNGVRNTVARERMGPSDLVSAVNVDIDDTGQVRRRRGYELKLAGNFHSVKAVGGRVLGVKDGQVGQIFPDFTFTGFGVWVGDARLSYAHVDQTTYFASSAFSGKLTGSTIEPWGAVADDGEWISPVVTPTETLGEVFGYQITAPPLATDITEHNGRIYLLAGRYVWATELWMFDHVRPTRNFLQLADEGTMLESVGDSLLIGGENGLYRYTGTLSEGFRYSTVMDARVVPGSAAFMPAPEVHPNAREAAMPEGDALVFMTSAGICAAFEDGAVFNLTQGRVEFPHAERAAVLYRQDSGGSSYIAVTDGAGGPAANARVGDYVDAEIIRAADRIRGI